MWAFAMVGTMGLFLGFQFRVPAVLVASFAVAATTFVASLTAGHALAYAFLYSAALLGVLQGAYLLGLVAAIGCGRLRHEKAASDKSRYRSAGRAIASR